MRVYFDTDLRRLVLPGTTRPQECCNFGRVGAAPLVVQFCRNGVVFDPGDIKPYLCVHFRNDWDGAALVLTADFLKTGSDQSTAYTAFPNFDTEAINAAFGENDAALSELLIWAEVGYRDADGNLETGRVVEGVITNSLYRQDPADAMSSIILRLDLTAYSGAALPALGGVDAGGDHEGRLVYLIVDGVGSFWRSTQDAVAVDNPDEGVVRPAAWDAENNPWVWHRVKTDNFL